jgi:hypothetical protein
MHHAPDTAHRILNRSAAWVCCVGVLVAATLAAFRGIEAWARPAFATAAPQGVDTVARIGDLVGSVALADGLVVRQEFGAGRDGLAGLRLRTVTWLKEPDAYGCSWALVEISADGRSRREVRSGTIDTTAVRDWEFLDLRFEPITDSRAVQYLLRIVAAPGRPERPIGLPLYAPKGPCRLPTIRREAADAVAADTPQPAALEIELVYAAQGVER